MRRESLLKQRAAMAKRRLQNGYSSVRRFGGFPKDKINKVLTFMQNDDVVAKICNLVQNPDRTPNPISYLIDKDLFDSMSTDERQRYIFRLSEAYVAIKNAYDSYLSAK